MCRPIRIDPSLTTWSHEAEANLPQIPSEQLNSQNMSSTHLHIYRRHLRRRSADVGGLYLALRSTGQPEGDEEGDPECWEGNNSTGMQGQGWMGGESGMVETKYAELLSSMYTATLNSVTDNGLELNPPAMHESVRTRLICSLNRWNFEPHLLPEEEVVACTVILFEALFRIEGMEEAIPLSIHQISAFVHHLCRIYRYENTYHNYEHALDVLQATQSYLRSAGMVPPPTFLFEPAGRKWIPLKKFDSGSLVSTLGLREVFILYVAAIGHDVGHPGFSNTFMKNAQTDLSQLFDHRSALEHLHYQLLLRVMRQHGFGVLLDNNEYGPHLRKLLTQSILTTDMGVHDDFMTRLHNFVQGESGSLCMRQQLMCQTILKNADISNPTRPFLVSKHWASALIKEWIAQSHLEKEYQLMPTVQTIKDDIGEADCQIFFITRFAKPLLELSSKALPELTMYMTHCKANLKTWQKRKKELLSEQKSTLTSNTKQNLMSSVKLEPSAFAPPPMSPSQSGLYDSAFWLALPTYPPPSSSNSEHFPNSTGAPSDHDQESISIPGSPIESAASSFIFSPVSDSSSNRSASTSTSISNSNSSPNPPSLYGHTPTQHVAIRAASKVALRNKKQLHGVNTLPLKGKRTSRNSWCANTSLSERLLADFYPPSASALALEITNDSSATPPPASAPPHVHLPSPAVGSWSIKLQI